MDENVDLVGAAADEAVAAGLVEPFEGDGFIVRTLAALLGDGGAGALHLDDVDGLPAARTQGGVADDLGAFVGDGLAIVAQAGDVDHHVAGQRRIRRRFRDDESITLDGVEPLHAADYPDHRFGGRRI